MLDMGTGGGEFLSSLLPLPFKTAATEKHQPNVSLARKRLSPLNVDVYELENDQSLPFEKNSFDLIINRHESYSASEVYRTLKPGGRFITQQVGDQNNIELNRYFGNANSTLPITCSLSNHMMQLKHEGFTIEEGYEEYPITHFSDIGAVIYYMKAIPWQIPNFNPLKHLTRLHELHRKIETDGKLEIKAHRFFIKCTVPDEK